MPELPEVETVRRGLQPVFVGARFLHVEKRRPNLRFPFPERFVERLLGRRVTSLERRAKYLLAELDSGETLAMHLGMSGSFRIVAEGAPATVASEAFHFPRSKASEHDHVVFDFDNGARVVYNDPRRFGFMKLIPTDDLYLDPLFADLGLEPLSDRFTAEKLSAILHAARGPLKATLLDQKRIAGLGNIYVCEALHRARLSPERPAVSAPPGKAKALHGAIRDVLEEAIAAGGSTLRDHRQADGELGYFQHAFAVYDREGAPCPRKGCKGTIKRIAQGGRGTFYCPKCQT